MQTMTTTTAPVVHHAPSETSLIVEDDLALARATRRALEQEGRAIVVVHDVKSGERMIRERDFDAILCDFELPDGHGTQVLACALGVQPEVPRILVTSHTQWDTAASCINEGQVFRVVAKPWDEEALRGVVDQALELKRLRDGRRELQALAAKYQRELAVANERLRIQNVALDREVQRRTDDFLGAVVAATDLRDTGARLRSQQVSRLAVLVGRGLRLDADALENLRLGALLHDIGSLGAADAAFEAGSPRQTESERRRIPELGWSILCRVDFLRGASRIVRHHRESWNGRGYPHGLVGEDIELGARVVAAVLRYHELVTSHPVVDDAAHDSACRALQGEAGATLDPAVVGVILAQSPEACLSLVGRP